MKKTCSFVLSLFAAGALSAAATSAQSDNVIGVLRVDSTEKQTVVAIPWVAAGVNADSIRVTDIVKTSTLTVGDQLFWYDNATKEYKCWALLDENKVWQPSQVVTEDSFLPTPGEPAENQALTRGNAIVLVRQEPKNPGYFFVQGQVAAAGDVVNTLPANADSLLAPPSATATNLNDLNAVVWGLGSGDHTNDRIIFKDANGALRTAKREGGEWKTFNVLNRTWTTDGVEIPAGQGAWYQNKSTETVTVTWKTATHR